MVRHGLNHSRPAVNVPMRAARPSETMSAAFMANKPGNSALYVCSCCHAVQIVASSWVALLSSMTTSGKPFTNNTMSARRSRLLSTTVN